MKLPILFVCLFGVFTQAFADDTQNIVDRKTCEQIKSEIAELAAVENPTAEQQENLKQLNIQQRTYCAIKGNGRRTVSRPGATVVANGADTTVTVDALEEYIAAKKSNCEKLNSEMEKLKSDSSKENIVKEMQRYYDSDCVEALPAETVVSVISEPVSRRDCVVMEPSRINLDVARTKCFVIWAIPYLHAVHAVVATVSRR